MVALAGTAFVVNTQRTGTVNFAKDNIVPKLSLQITPTLASSLGKINLHLEWTAFSGADHYQVNIFYTISPSGRNDTGGKGDTIYKNDNVTGTSLDIPSLKAGNGDYSVRIRAMNGNKLLKNATATYAYFEDGFKGAKLDSHWENHEARNSAIKLVGGKLNISIIQSKNKVGTYSYVHFPDKLNGDYDSSVNISGFSINPLQSYGMAGINVDQSPDWSRVGFVSDNNPQRLSWWIRILNDSGDAEQNDVTYSDNSALVRIGRTDGKIYAYQNGVQMNSTKYSSGPNFIKPMTADLFAESQYTGKPDVTASFDNFRLVWVK